MKPFGLPWWLSSKKATCNAGGASSIPGWGRVPGGGNGSPLQYPYLKYPMDRRASSMSCKDLDPTEATVHAHMHEAI